MAFYIKVDNLTIAVATNKEDAITLYEVAKSDKDVTGIVTMQEIVDGKEESEDSEGT